MTGREPGLLPFQGRSRVDRVLVRHSLHREWRGLILFAVMLLTGIAWSRMRPRSYRAEALFLVRTQGPSDGGPRSIERRTARAFGTRAKVIALIDRQRLYRQLRETESEAALAARFSNSLDWKVEGDTVRLGFIDGDAEGAQRAVQGLIELFVHARRDAAIEQARAALAAADAGIEALEGALVERQQSLDEFVLANEVLVGELRLCNRCRRRLVPRREVVRLASFRTRRIEARLWELADVLRSLRADRSSPRLSSAKRDQRIEWLERDLRQARVALEESRCEDAAKGDGPSDVDTRISLTRSNIVGTRCAIPMAVAVAETWDARGHATSQTLPGDARRALSSPRRSPRP